MTSGKGEGKRAPAVLVASLLIVIIVASTGTAIYLTRGTTPTVDDAVEARADALRDRLGDGSPAGEPDEAEPLTGDAPDDPRGPTRFDPSDEPR